MAKASIKKQEPQYQMPSSVRVMGRNISIVHATEEEFLDAGQMIEHDMLIKIKPGQLPVEEADTVLHETLHAIDYLLDLELSERQVRLVASCLIGVFQDNPEYAQFVTRPLNKT